MRHLPRLTLAAALTLSLAGCASGGSGATGDDDDDAGTDFPNPGAVDVPAPTGGLQEPLPDLTVDVNMLNNSWFIDEVDPEQSYYDCAVQEGCIVRGQGNRRLLKFDVGVVNRGSVDLILGDPYDHPEDFEYAACHDHLHYKDFAKYELSNGSTAKYGVKQAFCLIDLYDWNGDGSQSSNGYDCSFQGITAGWGDIYDSSLDCQWIDVTDLPPGDYDLTVNVNAEHKLPEAGPHPNIATVTITID